MFLAFWAQSLDDEIRALHPIAFGKFYFGNGEVFETDSRAAMFAMEMDVHIVVFLMVATVAKFVSRSFSILQHMDEMLFLE